MTYNIKSLELDGAAARRVVRAQRPDVLLLQEAPRWVRGRRRTRGFARDVGMVVVAGGIAGRGAAIAVAPHLVPQVLEGRGVAFEPRTVRFRQGFPTPRGYALARLARSDGEGGVLTFVSVHLSAQRPQRARHVPVYVELAAREAPDLVLGGDLNENPRGPSVLALQPPLRDADPGQAHTEPVDVPRTRLDGFLVGSTVTVHQVTVPAVPAGPDVLVGSDHRPAVLDMSW